MTDSPSHSLTTPTRHHCFDSPRSTLVVSAAIAIVLSARGPAFSQTVTAQAQSLFDQGQDLLKAGKIAEACSAFDASHKLDPAITTLLNLADCRAKNGQLATAWGLFLEAERIARIASNDQLARVAAKHAAKLKPRLSQLIIVVPADRQVPGLLLLHGDEPVAPATWNHALPIDGGPYRLTAKAPGYQSWRTTVHIKAEGDVQTIEIPTFSAAERDSQLAGAANPRSPLPQTREAPPRSVSNSSPTAQEPLEPEVAIERPRRSDDEAGSVSISTPRDVPARAVPQPSSLVLPLALGIGSVAFTTGAIAAKMSGDTFYERAEAATTQQARDSAYESANTRRRLALGLGGAAIACGGAAVYLYFRRGRETRPATTTWTPMVSPNQAGVALVRSW